MSTYTCSKRLDGSFEDAIQRVTEALSEEGFGILSDIDVAATLKKKLDVEIPAYRILGACNPTLAHKAIKADPRIGALLPCNVVVQESSTGISIDIASPAAMLKVAESPELEPLMQDAEQRLRRVLEAI